MTPIDTLIFIQNTFPPSEGWIVKYITIGCGVKLHHPEYGFRMCWVNGRGKRMRVLVKSA